MQKGMFVKVSTELSINSIFTKKLKKKSKQKTNKNKT